jgi:DNA recombination-dependent growth factor C
VDVADLRKLKNLWLVDGAGKQIADDAIEGIAKMMDSLKVQRLSKNFDELASFFIKWIKLLAKLT